MQCGCEPACASPGPGTEMIPAIILLSTIDTHTTGSAIFQEVKFQLVLHKTEVCVNYSSAQE